ncbi:SDR family oxidoreductase [Maribacter algarum]|uniref:SDR family oxidoreductase n=1 Tax=Maribacter algarum (ex Zhang et al. 2020) TaxID=2578118 RepID=A0A5S3PUR9_9FLAO|nr:SDR family oxidoreductase [Maribacter algarum]TMM58658.1 SDR family oxidoreductase [Maribacter algarum]
MIKAKYQADKSFVVLIGANSGIGQELIKQLLEAKAMVFGVDIQKESRFPIIENYFYFRANPLEEKEMVEMVKTIQNHTSHLNSLVNLSGTIRQFKSIESLNADEWNETYDISFKSCFNSCKAFASLLKITPDSSIVNMSSGLAFIGQKNYGPYSAGKASVISFSKTLAAELAPEVRVNTVAPGAVDTNFIYKEDGSTRFDKERYMQMVPLGSIAKPEEVSSVILFLLSDGASHLTGQCIHVNGGASMH